MASSCHFKDLPDFLIKHNAKNDKTGKVPTNTRIPDKKLNIYGGSYIIGKDELDTFMRLYYEHVFVKSNLEYLTEKQLETGGPILVDFDFRYDYDVDTRQHTDDHIQNMVLLYLDELKEFFSFTENTPFSVFIMEKPHVNRLVDKSVTKDGIHMVIGIQMDSIMQVMLRNRILKKLPDVSGWDSLPFTNTWDAILDEGISKGKTNWQMFGSRKPANEKYELSEHFICTYDPTDGEFMVEQQHVLDFNLSKNLVKLSAQYPDNPRFEMNPVILEEYLRMTQANSGKSKTVQRSKAKVRLLVDNDSNGDDSFDASLDISLESITNPDILKKAVDSIIGRLEPSEHELRETHECTQILPEKYYNPGSHLLNRQVAFALKHTDERLFLSWVMLRSKADDFEYSSITGLYQIWKKHISNDKTHGITRRSIMYWAKQDAPEEYKRVKLCTVNNYIDKTLEAPTDYDFAMALYYMYKDKYVCSDLSSKPIWYVFNNHRWEHDRGDSLRLCISREMYEIYNGKSVPYQNEYTKVDDQDKAEELKKKAKTINGIALRLKKTADKNNIMKEASNIFYDKNFTKNLDSSKWLMCFTNGVVDFKAKIFRDGYPQDYISKCTMVEYNNYDGAEHSEVIGEINGFMRQLFPNESLNRYMWDHLASAMIGINKNQTFNIYRGNGSNGKSKMTDLMTYALGEYKGTVPITLVTEKRNSIGGTSSEVMQLKGVRYAVMQEPSKDTRMNEGTMKELTGGDPLQARALYSSSETFTPQFKLCVCTNSLFEINSNDNGTWRRIRICDFMSTFVDKIDTSENAPPYQFLKDKDLEDKLYLWAPVFASMLVKRAFETDGHVEDCDIVMASSNKYRQGQDHISAFVDEMIVTSENPNANIKKRGLSEALKAWFQESQGMRKMPKGTELIEYMEKKYGKYSVKTGWVGIDFIHPEMEDDPNE